MPRVLINNIPFGDKNSLPLDMLIMEVENSYLYFFNEGKMKGTFHACVGQEFSVGAIGSALNSEDLVALNHRFHCHFISKTKKARS